MKGGAVEVGSLNNLMKLNGLHNMQNAACAYAAVKREGLSPEDILAAIKTYPGCRTASSRCARSTELFT
ncbi:MAG: hypothetical protein LRY39_01585 [Alphaproteobacteria bacterium]|nr:hypothetical protein [Alphaproteobacteria bacterium]